MHTHWTSYKDVAAYARSRAVALGITVVVRSTSEGWVLPYYDESSTEGIPGNFDKLYNFDRESSMSYVEDESTDCGDGSSGLSSNCGETLMDGYELFNRN